MYKLILMVCLATLITVNCHNKSKPKVIKDVAVSLNIGDKMPDAILEKGTKTAILASSSNIFNSFSIKKDNIQYICGVYERTIYYIHTMDPNFQSNEGFTIDTSLKKIMLKTDKKLIYEQGWGYYIPLQKNWNAAFINGDSRTDNEPKKDNKVNFFFKRK